MLLYGADKDLCQWASNIIFGVPDAWDDNARAIGVVHKGNLIAAVVYTQYQKNHLIEMSVASIDKRWATRHNLRAFFSYPFIDLMVKRVQTLCSANRRDIIMFNERLGFKQEGLHRAAWHDFTDAVSFGMLKQECRWL